MPGEFFLDVCTYTYRTTMHSFDITHNLFAYAHAMCLPPDLLLPLLVWRLLRLPQDYFLRLLRYLPAGEPLVWLQHQLWDHLRSQPSCWTRLRTAGWTYWKRMCARRSSINSDIYERTSQKTDKVVAYISDFPFDSHVHALHYAPCSCFQTNQFSFKTTRALDLCQRGITPW